VLGAPTRKGRGEAGIAEGEAVGERREGEAEKEAGAEGPEEALALG